MSQRRAFSDLTIVDFTHVLSGPFCTYQLALLGARVIKVEEPELGDYMRRRGSDRDLRSKLMGDHFLSLNSNKQSIVIDLHVAEGVEIAQRLISTADVVVENFRAGVMDQLGLGFPALSKINPRLIYCAISGYGRSGVHRNRKVYDQVVQAASGLMSGTGPTDGAPVKSGSPVLDYSSGLMACFAIAAALFERSQDGQGQFIDVSMHDTALMLMSTGIMNQMRSGRAPRPHGNDHPLAAASCYTASDGALIMLGCCTQSQFERLCHLVGRPDLAIDPKFCDVNRQDLHRDALANELQLTLATRTAAEWEALLSDEVPAARVKTLQEGLALAKANERRVVQRIEAPAGLGGAVDVPVSAFAFARGGPAIDSFPPFLGEHTERVLRDAGYSEIEIASFKDAGAVQSWEQDRGVDV